MKRPLHQLARLCGLQVTYLDAGGQPCEVSDRALLSTLRALGISIEHAEQAGDLLRRQKQRVCQRCLEPVLIAWDGDLGAIHLRLPEARASGPFGWRLHLEDGQEQQGEGWLEDHPTLRRRDIEGTAYLTKAISPPEAPLPTGYHGLTVELGDERHEATVIAAPRCLPGIDEQRGWWGLFLPLYALHRNRKWAVGDFGDLGALMSWTATRGGDLVATLPLLGKLWELDSDPSPYAPGTRLFWDETYLDIDRLIDQQHCDAAREFLEDSDTRRALQELREDRLIDYDRHVAIKRRVLQILADHFFETAGDDEAFLRFQREHPDLEQYARFRAVTAQRGEAWTDWPEDLRGRELREDDCDPAHLRRHRYAQWRLEQQLGDLRRRADEEGLLWYLDLPLGVSQAGYDAWSYPESFATDASGGAPPDAFFTKGQDWGFPPPHPTGMRETGYAYWRAVLRRHLSYARMLRIDHVMSLYRLWWVPHGNEASDGVYVRYRAEEMTAVLSVEAHRAGAYVIGENLGTVPGPVDELMQRHGMAGMYAAQFQVSADEQESIGIPYPGSIASINTHDMPPFHAFWTGLEIDDRLDLDLLSREEARDGWDDRSATRTAVAAELRRRGLLHEHDNNPASVLRALLTFLARSEAGTVIINLEDLWGETDPQNTPGTFLERPNWRRRARYSFDQFTALPDLRRTLELVNEARNPAAAPSAAEATAAASEANR